MRRLDIYLFIALTSPKVTPSCMEGVWGGAFSYRKNKLKIFGIKCDRTRTLHLLCYSYVRETTIHLWAYITTLYNIYYA